MALNFSKVRIWIIHRLRHTAYGHQPYAGYRKRLAMYGTILYRIWSAIYGIPYTASHMRYEIVPYMDSHMRYTING